MGIGPLYYLGEAPWVESCKYIYMDYISGHQHENTHGARPRMPSPTGNSRVEPKTKKEDGAGCVPLVQVPININITIP